MMKVIAVIKQLKQQIQDGIDNGYVMLDDNVKIPVAMIKDVKSKDGACFLVVDDYTLEDAINMMRN